MICSELSVRLLGEPSQGVFRSAAGWLLTAAYRVTGRAHYDRLQVEHVQGAPILILPSVFNPNVLRTGAFFAEIIAARGLGKGATVLDLGTGSGVCAVFAARHAGHVIAVDLNRAAVRCAGINAAINGVAERVECRHGDLFGPVPAQRFDTIFFNPPFYLGAAASERDAAWRSLDVADRFAIELDAHLAPRGRVYLLLSTNGNACPLFVDRLSDQGYELSAIATRRYINERVTILQAHRHGE